MTGQATGRIAAPPDRVFAAIGAVVHAPVELHDGTEWVVEDGRRPVRAHAIDVDAAERRLVYRSKPECSNPSFTIWTWEVDPDGLGGSLVTLAWELRPATLFDKRVGAKLRLRAIERDEAPASLVALAEAC